MTDISRDSNGEPVYSYDLVPYRSWPYSQSHPDRLACMATLFGITPQPIDQSRVLELGCASGGNLIPMAESLPQSRFIGIDLSEREVAEGIETVRKLKLSNIELKHMDISLVSREAGTFHYIIVHGLFSWVPMELQNKIFQICRENLEPNGVAYISYNTFPGWNMRGMIRQMLGYHVRQFHEPKTQIEQSRALLKFLADSVSTENNPYGAFLKQELDLFDRSDDSYLYHEHLERVNDPMLFHEFVERAENQGLQFLGESHLSMMASNNFAAEVDKTLQRMSVDIIQIEQYMDFLRNRSFRQSLLCHRSQTLDRSLNPTNIKHLYFSSSLQPDEPDADSKETERMQFRIGNVKIATGDPLIKAALLKLWQVSPSFISFDELMAEAKRETGTIGEDSVQTDASALRLGEHLIRCLASDAVEFHTSRPKFVTSVSKLPIACPLVRLQAESGQHVTNRKHETATLDEFSRHVILWLDGTCNPTLLTDRLYPLIEQEKLEFPLEEKIKSDPVALREAINREVDWALEQMSKVALLIG